MDTVSEYIIIIAKTIETIGVLTIFLGLLYSLLMFIVGLTRKKLSPLEKLRQSIGKSILLGLEVLIAADIILTVSTEPTLRSVTILGLIVLVRTILSTSLQVELEGKFPWQKNK
ncbi:DUF1622 domain-containing protein [Flavobacteriaceae bacterium]|jgi:uncharacterized membrane protein|nr:DUF1622 domain-containing protein [bacterium]MDA9342363.1 DUF1622 domain-containing protein [Flavobacteriaceae bacterium]MDB9913711.1 DUF1622 domain-containing protein [Flavobacteriaceae bacterium]|tara:strand:+ start:338 stop:679 length:342 start_codon:yes stop_codon:yes gene_type:complete